MHLCLPFTCVHLLHELMNTCNSVFSHASSSFSENFLLDINNFQKLKFHKCLSLSATASLAPVLPRCFQEKVSENLQRGLIVPVCWACSMCNMWVHHYTVTIWYSKILRQKFTLYVFHLVLLPSFHTPSHTHWHLAWQAVCSSVLRAVADSGEASLQ